MLSMYLNKTLKYFKNNKSMKVRPDYVSLDKIDNKI